MLDKWGFHNSHDHRWQYVLRKTHRHGPIRFSTRNENVPLYVTIGTFSYMPLLECSAICHYWNVQVWVIIGKFRCVPLLERSVVCHYWKVQLCVTIGTFSCVLPLERSGICHYWKVQVCVTIGMFRCVPLLECSGFRGVSCPFFYAGQGHLSFTITKTRSS